MHSTDYQTLEPHLKNTFYFIAACMCKHTHQTHTHTAEKHFSQNNTCPNHSQHTLIFSILLFSGYFYKIKEETTVVTYYVNFNTKQRKPSNIFKKPCIVDVPILLLNTVSNMLSRCFDFSKTTKILESLKKTPFCEDNRLILSKT